MKTTLTLIAGMFLSLVVYGGNPISQEWTDIAPIHGEDDPCQEEEDKEVKQDCEENTETAGIIDRLLKYILGKSGTSEEETPEHAMVWMNSKHHVMQFPAIDGLYEESSLTEPAQVQEAVEFFKRFQLDQHGATTLCVR